jgi:hypothetical protein
MSGDDNEGAKRALRFCGILMLCGLLLIVVDQAAPMPQTDKNICFAVAVLFAWYHSRRR